MTTTEERELHQQNQNSTHTAVSLRELDSFTQHDSPQDGVLQGEKGAIVDLFYTQGFFFLFPEKKLLPSPLSTLTTPLVHGESADLRVELRGEDAGLCFPISACPHLLSSHAGKTVFGEPREVDVPRWSSHLCTQALGHSDLKEMKNCLSSFRIPSSICVGFVKGGGGVPGGMGQSPRLGRARTCGSRRSSASSAWS